MNGPPEPCYDPTRLDTYADTLCGWGAGAVAASQALATLFQRLAEQQLLATQALASAARDPARLPAAFADYQARMMQMQTEMQGTFEQLQRETARLFETLRRGVGDAARAPDATPMGLTADASPLASFMKFGSAASEGVDGPGGWRFKPGADLDSTTREANTPAAPAPFPPLPGAPNSPAWNWLWWVPPLPGTSGPAAPWAAGALAPAVANYDELLPPVSSALHSPDAPDADVLASHDALRAATALSPPPPAPAAVYPLPSATTADTSGVRYRCDGYRRACRAKP